MRLVDKADVVLREVVEQAVWACTPRAALEESRVILDPVAVPELLHHLDVVLRPLANPM